MSKSTLSVMPVRFEYRMWGVHYGQRRILAAADITIPARITRSQVIVEAKLLPAGLRRGMAIAVNAYGRSIRFPALVTPRRFRRDVGWELGYGGWSGNGWLIPREELRRINDLMRALA